MKLKKIFNVWCDKAITNKKSGLLSTIDKSAKPINTQNEISNKNYQIKL